MDQESCGASTSVLVDAALRVASYRHIGQSSARPFDERQIQHRIAGMVTAGSDVNRIDVTKRVIEIGMTIWCEKLGPAI